MAATDFEHDGRRRLAGLDDPLPIAIPPDPGGSQPSFRRVPAPLYSSFEDCWRCVEARRQA